MKHVFLLTAAAILMGCASQIMSGFVGKPMTAVVGQYGFPAVSYDVDTNKRAFVWQINNSVIVPGNFVCNRDRCWQSSFRKHLFISRLRVNLLMPMFFMLKKLERTLKVQLHGPLLVLKNRN